MADKVFFSDFFEKRRTIETLTDESRADSDFYLFLGFSAFITTLGLILDNPIVIIGGMLIAPILFPILSFGMGIVTRSAEATVRALGILTQSVAVVVFISFVITYTADIGTISEQLKLASQPNVIFFLVAFFSGVVAAYSWVKQEYDHTLPGVAVTVSLVPPLAAIGIAIAMFSRTVFLGSLVLFLLNLIGIALASTFVFSMFGFGRLQRVQEEKIEEEREEKAEEKEHEA